MARRSSHGPPPKHKQGLKEPVRKSQIACHVVAQATIKAGLTIGLRVAGIIALIAAGSWLQIRKAHAESEVRYDTVQIDRGRIVAKVTATGTLSAIVTVQVGTQVSGTIASLSADFNSTVSKG